MMQRLFWRIFVAFWIATVFLLVAFSWVATSNFETEKIPGLDITRLQASMDDLLARTGRELRHDGVEATQQWLRAASGFGPVSVYLFGPDGRELLGRSTSETVAHAASSAFATLPAVDAPYGAIYSAEDGKAYKANLSLQADGTLRLRGYVGAPILGKTQIWTRVQ